jgi:hypothetical protein
MAKRPLRFGNRIISRQELQRRDLRTAQIRSETMSGDRRKPSLPKLKFMDGPEPEETERT